MNLDQFNSLDESAAIRLLRQCCSSQQWLERMVKARPFDDNESLLNAADLHWQGLAEDDYLEAFAGHPKIGDIDSLREKYADTRELAAGEQSGVDSADEKLLQGLAEANGEYQDRFGFIFIVFATGKSAAEMFGLLKARIGNSRNQELKNAAEEQRKITANRLERLF